MIHIAFSNADRRKISTCNATGERHGEGCGGVSGSQEHSIRRGAGAPHRYCQLGISDDLSIT